MPSSHRHCIANASSMHRHRIAKASPRHCQCIAKASPTHRQHIANASPMHRQCIINALPAHRQRIVNASPTHRKRITNASPMHFNLKNRNFFFKFFFEIGLGFSGVSNHILPNEFFRVFRFFFRKNLSRLSKALFFRHNHDANLN